MALIPFLQGFDWKPILELRARYERRVERDFSDAANDGTSDLFGRVRAGAGFTSRSLKGEFVYQYAYGVNYNFNTHVNVWRSDFVLANVQAELGKTKLTLGRQRLSFGSERLLGNADWNNVSNAWDGGRVAWGRAELFATKSALLATPNDELMLYGGSYVQGPAHLLAVYKHDDRNDVNEGTVSAQYRGQLGRFRIDAEAAGQVGHRMGKRKLAGAVDVIATIPVVRKLSFSVQGSVASGGGDGKTTRTFDQLYASGHDRHGLLDMSGWKNVRDLGLWFRYEPDKLSSVKLQYHALGLDSAQDAWYGGGGKANEGPGGLFVDATGAKGRDLGDEYDVDFSRALSPHQSVRAGAGIFQPGRFVRSFNGGSTRDQVFGYVQWTYRF